MKEEIKTGIGAGFLGSLCCVGPLILFFLGLGSIGLSQTLPNYRPLFLTLGFVFLAFGLFREIRKKHGSCNVTNIKKEAKMILIATITAVIIWFLLLYFLVPLIYGVTN